MRRELMSHECTVQSVAHHRFMHTNQYSLGCSCSTYTTSSQSIQSENTNTNWESVMLLFRPFWMIVVTSVAITNLARAFHAAKQLSRSRRSSSSLSWLQPPRQSHHPAQQQRVALFSSSSQTDSFIEWPTDRVRSTFTGFFTSRYDHVKQPSSPCAPLNDPTLLFTNAGMNQFKPIFLGQVDPTSPLALLKRVCNSQKCIRAGGKHNDLEDVGRDTYHHTFFEMLGSWSFGDYFKQEAIEYAWELLTQVYGLDPNRLYATYFQGNTLLEPDNDAKELWLRYLPAERVIGCNAKDNFWEMGDTGPCGPCSEIHYDRVGNRDAAPLVNADDPSVIEIWNIVFIQFNRDAAGTLASLPQKHIDTGMGLERLVSILQNKSSNYDIDVFQPIFTKIAQLSPLQVGYEGELGDHDVTLKDTAYRAIADHIRTLCFAIADGAIPNNEGRGYVLRRILRRATRYGQQILQCPPGFLAQLVLVVVDTFGTAFPELVENKANILEVIVEEEEAFSSMLDRGIKFFTELETQLKSKGDANVSGERAFFMYDTLGFPIDLTELMAKEAGLNVDLDGFKEELEAQKRRSREARKSRGNKATPRLELIAEQTAWLSDQGILATDDNLKYKWDAEVPATVLAMFSESGFLQESEAAEEGAVVGLILDKSSFYAEAGGQDTDQGQLAIAGPGGEVSGMFSVQDVQSFGGFLLHTGFVDKGRIEVGTSVNCQVDYDRRRLIAPNHSMTHVLNAALRQVLGFNADQRGSLCNEEKLRFDFSHKKAMTVDELRATEEMCQRIISNAQPVNSKIMPLAEAQAINGVRAVFGEVYPDPVRVVMIGDYTSIEFCGGTHVSNTAEAEAFVLLEETAVAKGIRRITAVTRGAAKQALKEGSNFQAKVAEAEGLPRDTPQLDKRAGALRKDLDFAPMSAPLKAELRGRIEVVQKQAMEAKKGAIARRVEVTIREVERSVQSATAENKKFLVLNVDIGADAKSSQRVINAVKAMAPEMAFLGVSELEAGSGGLVMVFGLVPNSLIEQGLQANDWVHAALERCEGRGGGKPNSAQGQAKECSDVNAVIAAAISFAQTKLGAYVM